MLKFALMGEDLLESREAVGSSERQVDVALKLASEYLGNKIAANVNQDPDLDHQMRIAGATIQGTLLSRALTLIGKRKEEMLRNELGEFWRGYEEKVENVCYKVLEWKGLSGKKLPQGFVETQVTALSRGVVGTITVARMLRRLGWEIEVPTPEEDVKGTDLKGEKGGQLVELQIKCRESSNLHVGKSGDKIFVVIPGRTSFFDDHELGIPEHRNFKEFENRFNNQLKKGDK